jgi:glycerophosphoryl diester phosphodiesterase
MRRRDVLLGAAALGACASTAPAGEQPLTRPDIIAHRGASGERPEHTLASYRLAIAQGANYIEPDLVVTRDGVLVCRHENEISGTTDIAAHPEFAARRATKTIDGQSFTGWFTEDFTLAELKTLRAKERLPQLRPANVAYDGQEQIPTFEEVVALARAQQGVGVYPELKHPTYLRSVGLDPTPAFAGFVQTHGGQALADMMYVQCFEVSPLITLASMSSIRWTTVQLMSSEGGPVDRPGVLYAAMASDEGLAQIADYARAVGVEKSMIVPRDAEGRSRPANDFIARAHRANLLVHPWTFRAENYFLPAELRRGDPSAPDFMRQHGDLDAELKQFYALGVDGVFCDFPAAALAARQD